MTKKKDGNHCGACGRYTGGKRHRCAAKLVPHDQDLPRVGMGYRAQVTEKADTIARDFSAQATKMALSLKTSRMAKIPSILLRIEGIQRQLTLAIQHCMRTPKDPADRLALSRDRAVLEQTFGPIIWPS
jgi:hypothetical protein